LWVSFAVSASVSTASANPTTPSAATNDSNPAPAETLVERGRYIVEGVGLCGDCHTPRTEKGELDRSRWLLGAALKFQTDVVTPPIAGLPSMSGAQGVVFLTTGKRPDGSTPRPPMPPYRMNTADASAVVAYLKSLSK
jgi:mono/diheme cytochrome c family protein